MQIVTVQFDYENSIAYETLLSVFRKSVKARIPHAELVEIRIPAPAVPPGQPQFMASNTVKLRIWRDFLRSADGPVIFSDCDMLATGDPFIAFDESGFDVAITARTQPCRFPYNGGVVFARPTEAAVAFFDLWSQINDRMTADDDFYRPYRLRYAGINQAALGWIMENSQDVAEIAVLPCARFNAVGRDQELFGDHVTLVHVKDLFRRKILGGLSPSGPLEQVMREWYKYHREGLMEKPVKIIAVYYDPSGVYADLLRVFRRSAERAMPAAQLDLINIPEPPYQDRVRKIAACFIASAEAAMASTEPVCVADIDLMFYRSIADVFDRPFDIAITVRDGIPYNTGLWFARPTESARLFLREWIENTRLIVDNQQEFREYVRFHGGIDQASLAMTLAENETARVIQLPCVEWNNCQDEWIRFSELTRVVHIKSRLRLLCQNKIPELTQDFYLRPIINEWRRINESA